MLPKPPACRGCLWYGNGRGFVPDEIRPDATVLILGQNPGAHEENGERLTQRAGKLKQWEACAPGPFLGDSGYDLERTYLPLAGLGREDVGLANVVRCRRDGSNELPPLASRGARDAAHYCQRAHFRPPGGTRVVVALGEWALWAATGEDGGDLPPYGISRKVSGWRGWALKWSPFQRQVWRDVYFPSQPAVTAEFTPIVYVTLHPASVYEASWRKMEALMDWRKLGELLAGRWPQPMPMIERTMTRWPETFSFDTEFYEREDRSTRLARWSASDGNRVWCVEAEGTPHPLPPATSPLVIMHQADADVDTLREMLGGLHVQHEDTLYAHAALHAESAHDLDFLGSLYGRTNRWKHLSAANPRTYAGGDALGTWDVWQGLASELSRDPQTEWVYRNCLLPLLPIVSRARRVGLRAVSGRVQSAVSSLRDAQRSTVARAQAAAGWPINLGSSRQVGAQLYGVERIK